MVYNINKLVVSNPLFPAFKCFVFVNKLICLGCQSILECTQKTTALLKLLCNCSKYINKLNKQRK